LARIRALAIPPAWTDVWICPKANGHIQATGRDVKGRKQYRYHNDWSTARSENKFDKLPAFSRPAETARKGRARPGPSRRLSRQGAGHRRAPAGDHPDPGGQLHLRQAKPQLWLTTLHKRHLEVDGSALTFEFRGKSGKDHRVSVKDRRLARVVRELEGLPGQQLFKYRTADGDAVPRRFR
jgi:DNA topoisomerase I